MANHHHDHQNGDKQAAQVVVVMVPLPAQGHLNQLLHLSRLISAYGIPVHYVAAAAHNRQARLRVQGWNANNEKLIHFHELPTPPFPSPPPDPTAANKFPSHLVPSLHASQELRRPVSALLRELSRSARRVVVIHDSLMFSVVQDVGTVPNAESYNFQSVSAFTTLTYFCDHLGKPYPLPADLHKHIPPFESGTTADFLDFLKTQQSLPKHFNSGNLYNTCKVIEAPYFDSLAQEETWGAINSQWAIGPFNPVSFSSQTSNSHDHPRHKCLEWLDEQDPNSVIFVSFGTTTSLSDEEIQEIAVGLELSNHKFIWVLRDADRCNVFHEEEEGGGGGKRWIELPKGYEERVLQPRGQGMVVRDWAPQLEILGHRSTGGFMSHCGWNSCMESISMGVPMAAWPMHSDQPRNSVLVTGVLKIGVVVRDWGRKDELVTSSMVAEAVRKLMGSEEGDEMRKRAAELGVAVRRSVEEGGVSRMELDSFVAHITR